jgi:phage recombination protein Bet
MSALAIWSGKELDLIRRTVAKDADNAEFDQFIHIAKHVRLDPLRRQIYCFVFNKNKPDKRQMTIVTAISGYRTIADRTGNYRPGPVKVIIDPELIDASCNPRGISHAEATVYKHAHGGWHEVTETAYWDEFAPLKEIWEDDKPTGKYTLDRKKDGWLRMPRVMLEKCAEAKALRRAWPDDFAGLAVEEETHRAHTIDLTASEYAEQAAAESKLALVGGKDAITVQWEMNGRLERVPFGQFADRFLAWANAADRTSTEVKIWWQQNLAARQEFKAKAGGDYLELQKFFEARVAKLEAAETVAEAAE